MPEASFVANSARFLQTAKLILPVSSDTMKDVTFTFSFCDVVTSRNFGVDTIVASIVNGPPSLFMSAIVCLLDLSSFFNMEFHYATSQFFHPSVHYPQVVSSFYAT